MLEGLSMKKKLSNLQKQLYNFSEMYPNDPSYNITVLYEIKGEFDKERFIRIADVYLNSFDVSKVSIEKSDNIAFNNCEENRNIKIEQIDCTNKDINEFREYVTSVAKTVCSTPIDIKKWPLIEMTLFHKSTTENMLLFNIHHIIADVYSFYSAIERVSMYYNSDKTEAEIIADICGEARLQYLDAIDMINGNEEADMEYFKNVFHEGDSIELKKISQQRNQKGLIVGRRCSFELDKELSDNIHSFVNDNRITDFAFFLAINVLFLHKITMEDIIVTGIPLGNRTKKELKDVFGYFVNTLPLKIDFSDDKTFSELCDEVLERSFELMKHQSFDLSKLNGWINGRLNNGFTFYKQSLSLGLKGCETTNIIFEKDNVIFELTGRVEAADNYRVEYEYGEFFEGVNIESVYSAIVRQAVENKNIKQISLIYDSIEEEYKKTNSYMANRKYDKIKNIFEDIAFKYPNNIAVKYCNDEYTYKELNEAANRISDKLLKKYPEQKKIAFSLNRKKELIALIIGIIKSGKTYVPIDTISPLKRSQYIINELGNITYIAENEIAEKICCSDANVICCDDFFSDISNYSSQNPAEISEEDPEIYMIYTSGSTGNPKGVVISNNNLASLMNTAKYEYGFNSSDVWSLFHSYGFDASVWEIFGCLLNGGKLIIIDPYISKSTDQFYSTVHDEKITVLNQTPTALKRFIKCDNKYQKELSLRYVFMGGETLHFNILNEWICRHPLEKTKMINVYGITETTIMTSGYEIMYEDIYNNKKSVIGVPLDNQGVYIVDNDLNILPVGVLGELVIYGDNVSEGYNNNPELTSKKFVTLPQTGQNVYLTGDLACINKKGLIEYQCRKDDQIQLRGFRVELGEIEKIIIKEFNTKQCSVQLVKYNENDERIVAFMDKTKIIKDKAEMAAKLRSYLPYYMIPSEYVGIDNIPMTVNGKVDKEKLIAEMNNVDFSDQTPVFKNSNEETIYNIIKDVSGIGNFKISDNLFDVGISSIHLPEIYDCIQEKFSIKNFDLVDLFSHPSIDALCELINNQKKKSFHNTKKQMTRAELRLAQRNR